MQAIIDAVSSSLSDAASSIIACIFFPFGVAVGTFAPGAYLAGLVSYAVKLVAAGCLLGAFEMSIAKMRVFRVPEFLGAALMFGFLATLLLFVSRGL